MTYNPHSRKRPRGICPGCGAERAINASGGMFSHMRMVRSSSGAFAYRTGARCSGVDQPPREDVE